MQKQRENCCAQIDVGLAFSRDGLNFTHLGGREPFIPPGPAGSFASKKVWLLPSPTVRGDEIILFVRSKTIPPLLRL